MPVVVASVAASTISIPTLDPNLEKKEITELDNDEGEVSFAANQKEDKVDVMALIASNLKFPIPSNIDSFTTVILVIGNNKVEIKAGVGINDVTVLPISRPAFLDNPATFGHTILVSDSESISSKPHQRANLLNLDRKL